MKILKYFAFILAIFIATTSTNFAQKGNVKKNKKEFAKKFMNKTDLILAKTTAKVQKNKVHKGQLKFAKGLRVKSKELFEQGKYNKAIAKSYKARRHAFLAFKDNGGKVKDNWRLTPKEKVVIKKIMKHKITEKQLRNKVKKKKKENEETNEEDEDNDQE